MTRNWTVPRRDPAINLGDVCLPPGRLLARRRGVARGRRRRRWLVPLLLVFVAGLFWSARWVWTAERFTVQRVETGPYRFTERAALERLLATTLGRSIWSGVDTQLLAALEALPWVRTAQVRRDLPDRLTVCLEEWQPLLQVAAPPANDGAVASLILIGDGRLLPAPRHLPSPELPWLVGMEPTWLGDQTGWVLASGHGNRLLDLMAAVAATGLEATAPVDFVLAGENGLSLLLQGGRERLLLGDDDFAARMRRYLAVRSELAAGTVVDLRFGNQVFVRDPPPKEADAEAAQRDATPDGQGPENGEVEAADGRLVKEVAMPRVPAGAGGVRGRPSRERA